MKDFVFGKNQAGLITDYVTRKYLTGVDISEGVVILTDKITCFTDARYFYAAKPVLENVGVTALLLKGFESVSEYLVQNGIDTLYIDYSRVTVKEYKEYRKKFKIKDLTSKLERARSVKSEKELALIEKACVIAQKAYHDAIKTVKKGITETQLKNAIEKNMVKFGASGPAFPTIVAFGANSAVPHHETGETVLEDNMPILVDMGCSVEGYLSDLTRTAFFGTPTDRFLSCYDTVKKANELAIENITHGTDTCTADSYARSYLKEKGLDEYFTHSLGHGVGMEVHEFPTLSPRKKDKLKNGMVFTIEPGVYFDGDFGIRIEDTVVLSSGKVKRLFSDSKELIILK
ncbi:MAG: aminopeptidase P family protein [Clostridia bacterium]|nr:aminopeptidase P family protein [Clostridia bacterium]